MRFKSPFPAKSAATFFKCVLLLFGLAALLTSCDVSYRHSDAFYDAFFTRQDSIANAGKLDQAMANIDSMNAVGHFRSRYFSCRRFYFKSGFNYKNNNARGTTIYMDSALNALTKYGLTEKYPLLYARILYSRGDNYFSNNQVDSAFSYFSRSREVALTLPDNGPLVGQQSYHLGMISYRQEKYDEAVQYFKEAFHAISYRKNDSTGYYWLQEILNNTALAYTKLEAGDSAKLYYQKALSFIKTEGDKYSYSPRQYKMALAASGVTMGNLAKVYIAQHHTDTAEQLLLKSIAINSQPGYENRDVVAARMQLAELYYQLHRQDEALNILQQMRPAADTVKNLDVELRWRKLMSTYYLDMHRPQEAEVFMRAYRSLEDSLNKAERKFRKIDYGLMLKQRENRYEVMLLKKENELKKLYLLLTATAICVVLTIMALIIINFRRSKKNVKTLTELNNRINLQNGTLAKALKDLRASNDDKDRILQVVAHDLRNPISVVVTIGGLLLEEEEDALKKKELNIIVKASSSVVALSEELLEFSGRNTIESGAEREVADLNELATQVVSLLQFKAAEKQQHINLQLPLSPTPILAFKDKINRVLNNLITNAIKFSDKNSNIDVSVTTTDAHVLIEVKDYGIGMQTAYLEKIFEAFTAAKRRGTAGERSYGLGLSICRQIVAVHKGKIWAESEPGKGSTFFVELPLARLQSGS